MTYSSITSYFTSRKPYDEHVKCASATFDKCVKRASHRLGYINYHAVHVRASEGRRTAVCGRNVDQQSDVVDISVTYK